MLILLVSGSWRLIVAVILHHALTTFELLYYFFTAICNTALSWTPKAEAVIRKELFQVLIVIDTHISVNALPCAIIVRNSNFSKACIGN